MTKQEAETIREYSELFKKSTLREFWEKTKNKKNEIIHKMEKAAGL